MKTKWSFEQGPGVSVINSRYDSAMTCLNCKEQRKQHHVSDKCLWGPTFYLVKGRWQRPAEPYHSGYDQRTWFCGACGVLNSFLSKRPITDDERTHCKACEAMNVISLPSKGGS